MGKPLLDVLRDVVLDPGEQAAFTADPATYLAQYGYDDVPAEHLNEAFGLVADTLPPDVAQAVADASPPAADTTVGDDTALEGGLDDASTFGSVNGDFDDAGFGDPATVADDPGDPGDPGDHDALAASFGEGSSDGGDLELGGPDTVPEDGAGFDATDTWGTPDADGGGFQVDLADDGLSALDTPDLGPDHDDGHLDVDDADDVPDHTLGDDPGDFLDDIGSF